MEAWFWPAHRVEQAGVSLEQVKEVQQPLALRVSHPILEAHVQHLREQCSLSDADGASKGSPAVCCETCCTTCKI